MRGNFRQQSYRVAGEKSFSGIVAGIIKGNDGMCRVVAK
jgi:hypothetical protein